MQAKIPEGVVALLLDVAPDERHRRYRRLMLDPEAGSATDALEDALRSPALLVHSGVCPDDPNEICVQAYGRDHLGRVWPSTTIILLDPEWDRDAEMAQALADDVVELWDRVRQAAGATV